jgi:hypothetical protein
MRFIRCARHRFEQNMVIFQYHGCIYYRTTKDVQINEELLVWYDSRYSMVFGIPVALNEAGSRGIVGNYSLVLLRTSMSDFYKIHSFSSGVNPPKGIVTQERSYGKRRNSDTDLPKVKRTMVDKESTPVRTTMDKSSAPLSTSMDKTSTAVIKKEPNSTRESIPSSALNYRNSMYHRGRWYTLPNNEGSSESLTHCTKCMKGFNNRETFLLHSCSKPTKNYTCAYCDRTCATLTELGKHMEDHVNERPFKCGYCPRSFNNAIALNLHVRIHGRHVSPKILHTQTTDKSRA